MGESLCGVELQRALQNNGAVGEGMLPRSMSTVEDIFSIELYTNFIEFAV